ncbi:putative HemK methyltransferase family member 1-like protein, partial [Naja naja]
MALLAAEAFAARTGRVVPSRVSDLHRPTQTCNFPFLQCTTRTRWHYNLTLMFFSTKTLSSEEYCTMEMYT